MSAERVLNALVEPVEIDGLAIEVGASIGVAASPVHGVDADALLQHADVAMYEAKQGGTRIEVYSADRDDNDVRRLALVTELRHAIDGGQPRGPLPAAHRPARRPPGRRRVPRPLVQPQLRAGVAGRVHPDGGDHRPHRPLTEHVLQTSLAQCALLAGRRLRLRRLREPLDAQPHSTSDLCALVERHLTTAGVPGSALTLELTESCLIGDTDRTASVLNQLRTLGVRRVDRRLRHRVLLAELPQPAVRRRAEDRSLLRRWPSEPAVAHRPSCGPPPTWPTTSGCPSSPRASRTSTPGKPWPTTGCDIVQGYLIARPQSATQFTQWLARHQREDSSVAIDVTPMQSTTRGPGVDHDRPLRLLAPIVETEAGPLTVSS